MAGAIVEYEGERVAHRRAARRRAGERKLRGRCRAPRDTYLPLPLVSVGHPGNTGDTIRLAQAAGASLWHMSAFFGWLAFAHPGFPAAFTLDVHAPSFIYLDGDGRRFADETGWEVHDRVRALTAFLPRRLNRPRLPGWIIFDDAARRAGPLHGIVGSPNGYDWSPDNSAEVAAGWIKRGRQPGFAGRRHGSRSRTRWAHAGRAMRRRWTFGGTTTSAGHRTTLVSMVPPLFSIPMSPGVATASGGPRRDAGTGTRAQRWPAGSRPVRGGRAGSIWGHLTEHGGGLTDAIVFGRLAGAEAAAG